MSPSQNRAARAGTPGAARQRRRASPKTPRSRPQPDPPKNNRHYRRARRDRGADTRARLVEAALDVFGRLGFEGATTRQIAREAGANLAAIVYHFGSKEALHIAVAEHIIANIGARTGDALAAAAAPAADLTPAAARAAFARLIGTFVDVILGSAEAERWARFIVREQLAPTPAFEVIYGFMGRAHGIATHLVAIALGQPEASERVRLKVFTMLGQVMVFRVAQALVLRRMEWTAIGEDQRAAIKRTVIAQIEAILDAETQP